MCWFYEIEYGACFDWFDGSIGKMSDDISVKKLLEDEYNVEIVDFSEFRDRVDIWLTDMHENGVIKPNSDCEEPTKEEIEHYFEGYEYKKFPLLKVKKRIRKEIDTIKDETDDVVGWFMDNYSVWEG